MAKGKNLTICDLYEPESVAGTEFRRLLHNTVNSPDGVQRKSFLITSAMLGEGKSTITSFLALTAASQKKKKTILIDCDLRRPSIHRLFGLPLELGLSELIGGEIKADAAFKNTPIENLKVLTAGAIKQNPTELFESEAVIAAIEEVKFYFDYVFVDCAPIIPVSDPVVLSPHVDGVILVIKAGVTRRETVKRALDLFKKSQGKLLGVVLNDLECALPTYYKYDYHYRSK